MTIFKNMNLLEIVEGYAIEVGHQFTSEDCVSAAFDRNVMPNILEVYGEPGVEFNDTIMVSEEFNNYTDALQKDGELHEEQVNNYEYTGEYS